MQDGESEAREGGKEEEEGILLDGHHPRAVGHAGQVERERERGREREMVFGRGRVARWKRNSHPRHAVSE